MRVGMTPISAVRFGNCNQCEDLEGFPNKKEKQAADTWLKQNQLNEFGDPDGTMYAGGSPIFYSPGVTRYQYLVDKFPDKPWIKRP